MKTEEKQDFFLSQVRRLGGLDFTPQTAEAWTELAKVLKRCAKSAEHARRIIGRFTEEGAPTKCPTPGELAVLARNVPSNPEYDRPELPDPCPECQIYGGSYRLVTHNGVEGMARCSCPRGRKLQSLAPNKSASAQFGGVA